MYVPAGWTTHREQHYGIDYYFLSAPKTQEDPNTNINVITESMRHLTLEEFTRKAQEGLLRAIPSAIIHNQGNITANGVNGAWYKYSMTPRGIDVTLIAYIFPKDSVAYIITAGTQTKDADNYRQTFDKVARSFKFDK
ncbi:hypothetical protein ECE50_020590 [Chitinophaga sp. Mgbs1]|uniref:DUF1795 domain-containing protein n=1 Tax=Chitinophaga solisilvae TaxID=1233460 RepID=A0A9Q5DCR1_9BACT|nr:hypothetical protein [Chitinophaga solisilvae]